VRVVCLGIRLCLLSLKGMRISCHGAYAVGPCRSERRQRRLINLNSNAEGDFNRMDEMFKAASELSTQIDRSPYASEKKNSAFCARFRLPAYAYYEQNPQKGARFAQSIDAWSKCELDLASCSICTNLFPVQCLNEYQSNCCGLVDGQVTRLVHSSFPWKSLKVGKVVDIGGGSGHISVALDRVRYPLSISPSMVHK
jgi:hypothetical protein